jgi:hypothetical protein
MAAAIACRSPLDHKGCIAMVGVKVIAGVWVLLGVSVLAATFVMVAVSVTGATVAVWLAQEANATLKTTTKAPIRIFLIFIGFSTSSGFLPFKK